MRAIMLTGPGRPEVVDLPDPRPAEGQVRIRTAGSAVNAADLHILDSGTVGIGLGLDVAGVVDEVGPGVSGLVAGTPVAALHLPHAPHATTGAAAEYLVVPASDVAPVPAGVDLLDAATVPLNSLTAAQLLALLGAPAGRLLVTGAAGGVGGYAVALAARAGWAVTALARATDTGFLTRAGVERVVTNLPGHPDFDAVLDAALLGEAALKPVRDNGSYLGVFPGREPAAERGIRIAAGVVAPDGVALAQLLALTADGTLEPRRAATVNFEKAASAYEAFRGGGQRGRWVLTP
ncbi:zinc-binding dehydrogenase [Amycolatopsis mongoliensis]|uniref:Zinc-binding dehydrogenase n=1 Tax=Amycolatopsis mongoliensis TaxID=715475 RepID=A0A9Y2NBL1_9PSEU|nr:zinc-binding dehydrogenase [Amycolatopsis sp. 4-36]WIX98606.1 zinc-binding dehydrogenase [Amycolatopsis sp. 4-36]